MRGGLEELEAVELLRSRVEESLKLTVEESVMWFLVCTELESCTGLKDGMEEIFSIFESTKSEWNFWKVNMVSWKTTSQKINNDWDSKS